MKIDQKRPISIDQVKSADRKASVKSADSSKTAASKLPDSVDETLNRVTQDIQESGLTASEVHSYVDEARISGFLKSMDVESKRPRLSDEDTLKMADKVASAQTQDPEAASRAFSALDPRRVAELV